MRSDVDLTQPNSAVALQWEQHLEVATAQGRLRGPDSLLSASNDLEAIKLWLAEMELGNYSQHTLSAARKESERLVLWAAITQKKPISDLTREDMVLYKRFLSDPQPAEFWCGQRFPRKHPRWKPFWGGLSPASCEQAMRVISSMFAYLIDGGHLKANPISRMTMRGNRVQIDKQERLVTREMWDAMQSYVQSLSTGDTYLYERARFVFNFMYLLAPRIADLPNHTMGDIDCKMQSESQVTWWWSAVGKGRKRVVLPFNNAAQQALIRWREMLGLVGMPEKNETYALVPRRGQLQRSVSKTTLYVIIKDIGAGAAALVEHDNPLLSEKLVKVSPHWLRHAALTNLAKKLPISMVRDYARHSNIKTTSLYLHSEQDDWYDALQAHSLDWN